MYPIPINQAPAVYVGRFVRRESNQVAWVSRLLFLALSIGCLALLITAAGLSPSSAGVGTHRQLHLQECGFLLRTGLPCPACGMTTSFAWFVRGNFLASLYIQPMGFALAILCSASVWIGGYIAITGRPLHRLLAIVPEKIYLIPLLTLAVSGWAWKIFIHLKGMDGWH
jgi:hypothetical protein